MDRVFSTILQNVIKQLPGFVEHVDDLKDLPSNLQLNVFPCYRQTLDYITTNCFSLPKVKLNIIISIIQLFRSSYKSLNIFKIKMYFTEIVENTMNTFYTV